MGRFEETKIWINMAKRDLKTVENLINNGRYPIACFMAQQAVVKAIKGYIDYIKKGDIESESIYELTTFVGNRDPIFSQIQSAISLDQFYYPTRYPDCLPGGTPYDIYDLDSAKSAKKKAKKAVDMVLSNLDLTVEEE